MKETNKTTAHKVTQKEQKPMTGCASDKTKAKATTTAKAGVKTEHKKSGK
ncbi:MAG: hypothetical protein IJW42_06280 [Alistipes sp.]|nr:hypothetical protein [Alistipes sp.]